MKIHYINILLFAFPLNILAHNNNKPYITSCHTPKIPITRLLCECELYAPVNYDNDPEMKKIMQQFMDRTTNRLREYDDRMVEKRNHCKDKCDKEIQKIILKDKLEKQMAEQLTTLDTNIITDDIPTCICEKSVADKVEKTCLKCGRILGTAVPELSLIGGIAVYAAAQSATMKAFISETIEWLKYVPGIYNLFGEKIADFVTPSIYGKPMNLVIPLQEAIKKACTCPTLKKNVLCGGMVEPFAQSIPSRIAVAVNQGVHTANDTWATATTPTTFLTNPFVASSIAIMIIVAIVLIIYLILRYRRKQKIKKKIQYIKLL
ncbi:rifin [Plasmodium falciparum IGH-CR14]|uniref:Rifin n=1 Tax=Plasmodium falciparum IGH-CR14 TaxID=580059 RepID=A0A0L1I6F7_PLAFA|nr:rifin [Plasmodium falciparum IGH-CR14]